MTTLISYHSSGGDSGRCDARCYDATWPACTCICSGKNHGAGLDQAAENTRELAEHWVKQARERGQDVAGFQVSLAALQEPMFPVSEVA